MKLLLTNVIHIQKAEIKLDPNRNLVCLFVAGWLCRTLVVQNLSGPTYQGHHMEWWLDYANKTGPDGISKLHLLLTFSPFENEFGFFSVRNRDITAMALLLEQNQQDEKVWAYLEELFGDMLPPFAEKRDKQSKGRINMSKDRARFLQRIAQHNDMQRSCLIICRLQRRDSKKTLFAG